MVATPPVARPPPSIKGELLVRVQMPEAKAVSGGAAITRDYRNRLDSGRAVRTPTFQQSRDRLHKGGMQLHFRHLWPVPRHGRCDAPDVDAAGASPRHRFLRPPLPARRLWRDPRRVSGG